MDDLEDHGRLKDSCITKHPAPAEREWPMEATSPEFLAQLAESFLSLAVAIADITMEEFCKSPKFQGLPEI